jgi:hypothetical protein
MGSAISATGSIPLIGSTLSSGLGYLAGGAAVAGSVAAPIALVGAAGYGVYKLYKWLQDQ